MNNEVAAPSSLVPITILETYDTSKVKEVHLYCDCGSSEKGTILGIYDDWALWIKCSKDSCSKLWYICNRCIDCRKKIKDKPALDRHHRNQHLKGRALSTKKRKTSPITTGEIPVLGPELEEPCDNHLSHTLMDNEISDVPDTESVDDLACKINATASPFVDLEKGDINDFVDWADCASSYDTCINDQKSMEYFQHCHGDDPVRGGMKYLVKRSIALRKYQESEIHKMDTPDHHVDLQMEIAMLCCDLSVKQHDRLARIIHGIWRVGCEDGYVACEDLVNENYNNLDDNDFFIEQDFIRRKVSRRFQQEYVKRKAQKWGLPIVSRRGDIRRVYTEQAHSIVQNLPHPPPRIDIDGHAYVSIIDCLRDFFGHGKSTIAVISDKSSDHDGEAVRHTSQSKRARDILANAKEVYSDKMFDPICSYLIFWSDDFEPNAMKSGRGGAWIKTMTIATTKENGHKINNTYVIAIGKKKCNHDAIEQRIINDLDLLKSGTLPPFYVGPMKKSVHMHFELMATLQDQPERRSANHLMAGNSTYAARWGVTADHKFLHDVLKACNRCVQVMVERFVDGEWDLPVPDCGHCLNWDVLKKTPLARFPAPKSYPEIEEGLHCRTVNIDNQLYIRPFRIDYQGLRDALAFAHDQFCNNNWTSSNCEAYLKVEGLNNESIKEFIEHSINVQSLRLVENNEESRELIQADRKNNPHKYERYPDPPLWTRKDIPLSSHIDAIMHLLFLGLVKTVVLEVQRWLSSQNMNKSFLRDNAYRLDAFNSMYVDWLTVLPYTGGKFGAWVSKNWLSFSRISLWFYQNLKEAKVNNEDAPPPDSPPSSWLVRHNRYWLAIRGLDPEGNATELKQRVRHYINQKEVPNPIAQPERVPGDVEHTLIAMVNLLQCVMTSKVTSSDVRKTDYAVRIFLSVFDKLDRATRDEEDKSTVTSKYNFPCLMNLPEAMATYGPLRDLWEGGPRGEGILRFTKPLMNQGCRVQWFQHLLKKMLIRQSFENVRGPEATTTPPLSSAVALRKRSTKFHKYETVGEARGNISQCKHSRKHPVSVILLEDGSGRCTIYCVATNYDSVVEVTLDPTCPTLDKFGLTYHKFNVAETEAQWANDIVPQLQSTAQIGYGLLLPLLNTEDDSENSRLFALTSSNWKFLQNTSSLLELIDT